MGLDRLPIDALLKRHTGTEPVPTHDDIATDLRDAVRLERAPLPSRTFTFGPESEEQLPEETLLAWQSQGSAAAWQAMFDLLAW